MGKIVSEADVSGSAPATRQHLLEETNQEDVESGVGNAGRRRTRSSGKRPEEPWKGEFVKSIMHAGLDAIITRFSVISINAGKLSSGYYLVFF
ncbi:hypothetical protein MLD38_035619 [Melastoma candidum]|uniref:Uncharacterized protein n=1 Tax=Melastoma candidum TaxID=119954 RepID=A0ACB9LHJ8_9MYRT|nr:hypothetical protein MLD38_035619 [Melastoma candidum]